MLKFKDYIANEATYVDKKGNLVSDERDQASYTHSPDADAKIMHIASMYNHDTFENKLFDGFLHRKFKLSIFDGDVYNSLATALRDKIIDEADLETIYNLANSKDLDVRTDNYKKLILFIDSLKDDRDFNFDKFVNNVCANYKLDKLPSFIDTLEKALEDGKMDVVDLRNIYNASSSPIYVKKNEGSTFPKASDYLNLSNEIETIKIEDKIQKVDLDEYEIVKVVDILSPKEVEKIEEMQVLNLGTTMPKDIKRGDDMYLTVMLQPKNKTTAYNVSNTLGVVRVRVMDIYQGLGILKSKGLL